MKAPLLIAVGVALMSGSSGYRFSVHESAYYADPTLVDFVRPGLAINITDANIGSDGTITADFTVTDRKGLPLDIQGVTTPGSVSASFVAAYIPGGSSDWTALTANTQQSPITGRSANQPAADSGGTITSAGGGYRYTFRTRTPSGFDLSQIFRIGVYSTRNLSEFDLGTNYADDVFTFVPKGIALTGAAAQQYGAGDVRAPQASTGRPPEAGVRSAQNSRYVRAPAPRQTTSGGGVLEAGRQLLAGVSTNGLAATVVETVSADVVATESCNRCHDPLAAHGGSRRIVALCVMCHNPGGNGVETVDPDTGNSIDFKVMVHKIHMGESLPSVEAGTPYRILGFRQSVNDYSDVVFPADVRNCQMCHEQGAYPRQSIPGTAGAQGGLPPAPLHVSNGTITGGSDSADSAAAPAFPGTGDPTSGPAGATAIAVSESAFLIPEGSQEPAPGGANRWLTRPSIEACGACHDNVNFQTGENHAGGLAVNNSQCAQCHLPQGDLPFDASIAGAHTIPQWTPGILQGVNFKLISASGKAGETPTVTFSVLDNAGNSIDATKMNLLNLVMAGPATDYATLTSENARGAASAGAAGTYTYTFTKAIPADAAGTWTMAIEGYRNVTVSHGDGTSETVRDVGFNQLLPFSVDGSAVSPPRLAVVQQDCNACHYRISAHGTFRQNVQYCLLCHNPTATDAAQRPAAQSPAQSIDFPVLIHRLHTGDEAAAGGQLTPFIVFGFGQSQNNFSDVRFPGDLRDCGKCHVNNSSVPPLPETRIAVTNPRAFINPSPPTTAACTACHTTKAASAHADVNTSPSFGESCSVCHGQNAEFSVDKEHARTL